MKETELVFEAIRKGNQNQLKRLFVDMPELVNIRDSRGFTPLIFASYFDNVEASQLLLAFQADVDGVQPSQHSGCEQTCAKIDGPTSSIWEPLRQQNMIPPEVPVALLRVATTAVQEE